MQIKDLIPWNRKGGEAARREDDNPIVALQRDMNRVFENFWNRFDSASGALERPFGPASPKADVAETEKAVEVSVELPGMDEKDIEVSVSEDVLTIKGEKKSEREEKEKGYYLSERSFGAFYRSIPLPPGVAANDAQAAFKNGVLTITVPKTPEARAKVKKIAVKTA